MTHKHIHNHFSRQLFPTMLLCPHYLWGIFKMQKTDLLMQNLDEVQTYVEKSTGDFNM
jgi:hypothetical protein